MSAGILSDIPQAVPELDAAFEHSATETTEQWLQRCRDRSAQLWRLGELHAITQLVPGKQGVYLQIVAMGGKFDAQLMRAIEDWGRSVGCIACVFAGRRGWIRRLPDYSLLPHVTLIKEL